jgi:UDP-N-acetylmuramate--alanine ligase
MEPDWSERRLHFVGVGGAGMSGLALIAQALGAQVTGSDRSESVYVTRLREHGIEPRIGHAAGNVPAGAEVVYSTAVPPENPERAAAERELHRADLLAEIAALKRCLAVTGTHGKTTTAAMAAHALQGAGLDPAFVIGAELPATGLGAGWGSGEWIVVEADESDRSLLKLDPEIAILTNAELDHHATYASRLELEGTFATFMARAGDQAVVWDRPALRALCPPGAVPYDAVDPELTPEGSRFRWGELEVTLSVPGAHNAVNAAGALTACTLAGADPARAVAALGSFRGARRRLELAGSTAAGAAVYDDYAHHPTELTAILRAAREVVGAGRLVVAFQPHRYTRTAAFRREFGEALALADQVVVLEVYAAGEDPIPGASGASIAAAVPLPAEQVAFEPSWSAVAGRLADSASPGDLILTLGAGDVTMIGPETLALLANRERR